MSCQATSPPGSAGRGIGSGVPGRRAARVLATAVLIGLVVAPLAHAESTFTDVRLVVGRHGQSALRNPGLDEVAGVLILDEEARRLRFEAPGRQAVEVRFEAIGAIRFEESSYPRRLLRRRGSYLIVHHAGPGGADVTILRLPGDSAEECLAILEREAGPIDRSPSTASFAGLPLHAGPGDVVYVTRLDGQRIRGTVGQLGLREITLETSVRLDEAAIREIDVSDPVWGGVVLGAGIAVLPAGLLSWSDCLGSCSTAGLLTPAGWGMVAAGAVIGGLIDRRMMRRAYRRTGSGQTRSLEWAPLLARGTAGVTLRLTFTGAGRQPAW